MLDLLISMFRSVIAIGSRLKNVGRRSIKKNSVSTCRRRSRGALPSAMRSETGGEKTLRKRSLSPSRRRDLRPFRSLLVGIAAAHELVHDVAVDDERDVLERVCNMGKTFFVELFRYCP